MIMLPVRAVLSRRIVTRTLSLPQSRQRYSTQQTGKIFEGKENNVLANDANEKPRWDAKTDATSPTNSVEQLLEEYPAANTSRNKTSTPSSTPEPHLGTDHTSQSQATTSVESSTLPNRGTSTTKASSSSAPRGNGGKPESWEALSAYDLEVVKQRIREWTEQAAISIRERADGFTAQTKTTFSQLGSHLNRVTGYEEIEALKLEVVEQEEKIKVSREAARRAKLAYQQAVLQRSNSQREVNDLLQRKSMWTENDVGRFTSIVRQDHLYEQEEARAKAAVDETEAAVEREFSQLMRSILARYHEEQVWSDKIRSASTYGSLAVLGLNLLVFIVAIVFVEPWKRRRLAQTFEAKIQELSVENAAKLEASMDEIGRKFVNQEGLLVKALEELMQERETRTRIEKQLEETPAIPIQVLEVPVKVESPALVSPIPGVPIALPQRTFELAAVGVGAFVLGVIGTMLLE